ncbi:MAG: glycine--tRNA ligase subunit alpha [Acidobacteria bacterium]|nr:glycine--tRNA ligase subunit alpha [Acidobacteriota bacterium]
MTTLQQLIFKLSEFWASRGCLLQQPLDIEMGAGTMHPETFLRVLGPARWNVAYVQPSRRPADGRFGENPNRLFKHHQFQVLLKPAPDEVQQLYLQSLDGQEITQFTYFQQAGGIDLSPIAVELTYGLERLAMALQDVDDVFELEWGAGVKYRDVRHRDEVEQSKYAFGHIDMLAGELHALHRTMFDQYYGLAQALLRSHLVLPALDYCLKCSHMFNLLDASGGIGVTERMNYILRVRQMAVAIAKSWVGEDAEKEKGEGTREKGEGTREKGQGASDNEQGNRKRNG